MPIMRKIVLYLLIMSMSLSCNGGGELAHVPLSISQSEIKCQAQQSEWTLTITSPKEWRATSNEKWVSISPKQGKAGTSEVTVAVQTYSDDVSQADRRASVSFLAGEESASLRIVQRWSHCISLLRTEYTVGAGGGEVVIDGLPDVGFMVNISVAAKEWLRVQGNVLRVAMNEKQEPRNAVVGIVDNVNRKQYEILLIQKGLGESENILALSSLLIDDYACPTDSFTPASDFFYSVDMDASASSRTARVEFRGEGVEWITIGDNPTRIQSGDMVTFEGFTPNSHIKIFTHNNLTSRVGENILIVTGLPLMTIHTTEEIPNEPKVDCQIQLFDPKSRTDAGEEKNLQIFECAAGIEQRGNGALRYPKKSYNFKLKDVGGNKREAKLLGIRNDNSWILDAMYLDLSRMRNRVSFDLWNTFNKPYYVDERPKAMSGTRGEYIEMFINGKYAGIYSLSDRIDRKQLQIEQQGGFLYKSKHGTDATQLIGYTKPSNDDYYWNSAHIEQEYPGQEDGTPNFNHMAEFIDFVSKSDNATFSAQFSERIAENSIIDAFIYLNLLVAHDNMGWNSYWYFRDVNTSKKIVHCLWDLDGTWGRNWCREKEDANQGWVLGNFRILHRIVNGDVEGLHQKIYDRWQELKSNQLQPEKFDAMVDYYAELQIATGARDREVARWRAEETLDAITGTNGWVHYTGNYGDVEGEIAYMKSWYRNRVRKLDTLFAGFNKP